MSKEKKLHSKNHTEYHREYHREYRRKNFFYFSEYQGVVLCPKCGKKGYKSFQGVLNLKTKRLCKMFTQVNHIKRILGKNIYLGSCYIGMGRL